MENNEKETFKFTYSAKEQEEIKAIRKKYTVPEQTEDKMAQLLRLDASVTKKGTLISLIFGIIGSLVLGVGMCLAMDVLSIPYGMPIGIAVGIIGIACIIVAYPLYTRITEKEKARLAPEILRLTDELMNR